MKNSSLKSSLQLPFRTNRELIDFILDYTEKDLKESFPPLVDALASMVPYSATPLAVYPVDAADAAETDTARYALFLVAYKVTGIRYPVSCLALARGGRVLGLYPLASTSLNPVKLPLA